MSNKSPSGKGLKDQLSEASREMDDWPQWMKDQARFLGGIDTLESPNFDKNKGTPVREKSSEKPDG